MKNFFLIVIILFTVNNIYSFEIEKCQDELKDGVIIKTDNDIVEISGDYKLNDIIKIDEKNSIRVISCKKIQGRNILIPVEIRDTELARGIDLEVNTPQGIKTLKIPKRRVFVPNKFYLFYPNFGEKGKGGAKNGNLILEVYPKISHHFQISIDDTADYGLVGNFAYENVAKGKIYDILNDLNKRDINIEGEFKYDKTRKFALKLESIFEKRTQRKTTVSTLQPLSKRLNFEFALNRLSQDKKTNIGGNIIYHKGNKEFTFGNITSKVNDFLHIQMKIYQREGNIILRLEDFATQKQKDYKLKSISIKRYGCQINLSDKNDNLKFSIGNLIIGVEDNPYFGQVDDKVNFSLEYIDTFGTYYSFLDMKRPQLGLLISTKILGQGDDCWIRGKANLRLSLNPTTYLEYKLSDDFINIYGNYPHPPWQNRSLIFLVNRKLFDDKTIIGKFNLEYIFLEYSWSRTDYRTPFAKTQREKYGFGKTIEPAGLTLPLEFFVEKDVNKKYEYGISLSFRAFM